MVDAVVTVFLDRLLLILEEESRSLSGVKGEFEKLQNELKYMRSFLKDAERLKRKNETLRCTLANLRELIYEAEDILADCELLSNHSGKFLNDFSFRLSALKFPSKRKMGKRLGEINEKITSIREKITSYVGPLLLTPVNSSKNLQEEMPSIWTSSIYDHTQVVGLEGDTRKLKGWLFQADHGILPVGIVGLGGLGKTTLAKSVFSDKEVEIHFEKRIWVSVSQTFTEDQVMRSMMRNLGDANTGDDCGELLKKINQFLLGKRFLIVMDDLWSKDCSWWEKIYEGLPKGNGSCVIVTTRNEEVARAMGVKEVKIHRPKFLGESDSWLLFCKVAFAANHGFCTSTELESIGKEIVSKCGGLPLAIKAVGGVLLCKPPYYHEWKRIADDLRDELAEGGNRVMASLQLSYDELPSHLKSCFLSLSIYPEDCVISKTQLLRWWIGEGFVHGRNKRLSTEASEDCFSGLTNRCLLEVVQWDYNGNIFSCKVHDMVRDLVIKIAADEFFSGSSISNRRHLGLTTCTDQKHVLNSKKLRALVSTCKSGEVNKIPSVTANKFSEFRYLRVLDLSKSIFEVPLAVFLSKIGYLKHLKYLNLSNTHPLTQLPPSLEKVHNLQILDLSHCHSLKTLPAFVVNFQKLAVLDVSHCGSLDGLPNGLEMLSNLEVLLGFKPARASSNGSRIAELGGLKRLRELGLQLTRADEIGDEELGSLQSLVELQVLTISCFNFFEKELVNKLEKLHPPSKLHELSLKFYPGKFSPSWLNPASLPVLRYLSICGGNLAALGKSFWASDNATWKIEGLKLDSLSHLCVEWDMLQLALLSLRTVHASWCPELRSFPIDGAGFRGGVWKKEEHYS